MKTYRKTTFVCMLPILLVSECGVVFKSLREGWLSQKIHSYVSVALNIKHILNERYTLQSRRVRNDRDLLELLRGGMHFSPAGDSSFVRWGNSLLEKYKLFLINLRAVNH